ncbi:MAG: hypothetical protein J0L94_07550 [Rhodothermia bacterium]|nr:hypothetical protein [Rhodothermia bacterium]
MDYTLHQKKGLEHLNKVLRYYPMVAEGTKAVVGLTGEDWHVLCDTLFHMKTPREAIPALVTTWQLSKEGDQIILEMGDGTLVWIEMF